MAIVPWQIEWKRFAARIEGFVRVSELINDFRQDPQINGLSSEILLPQTREL